MRLGRLENDLASRDKQLLASPLPSQQVAATPGMARVANLYESASNFINGQPGACLPGLLTCGLAVACGCVAITRVQRRQLQ